MSGPARGSDRVRQVVVTLSEIFCVVGTLVGTGVIGTRVAESSGGALADDATRIAPAGPAFSIWSVIYLGLLALTLYQWLPNQTTRERHRATGYLVAASMVLNATWLLVTQADWIWVSVLVIVALVVVLGVLVRRLTEIPADDAVDAVVMDGTLGLYLGWVSVAVCANITAALVSTGADPSGVLADAAAVGILAVVAGLGVVLALRLGGRLAVAGAMAWGLVWIVVGRLTDDPRSVATAIAAAVAALVVVGAALRFRSPTPR